MTAPIRGKQKAWRLSLVAEDDLIARALILQELKHRPFLDLIAKIGEREVFAVLIDSLEMRGEPPASATEAFERIRAKAVQQVVGERDALGRNVAEVREERDKLAAAILERRRVESEQQSAGRKQSVANRRQREQRRIIVCEKIATWVFKYRRPQHYGLATEVLKVLESVKSRGLTDSRLRLGDDWQSEDWAKLPSLRTVQGYLRSWQNP